MCLAEDRDEWRADMNTTMNLRVPYQAANTLTSRRPLRSSRRTQPSQFLVS